MKVKFAKELHNCDFFLEFKFSNGYKYFQCDFPNERSMKNVKKKCFIKVNTFLQ